MAAVFLHSTDCGDVLHGFQKSDKTLFEIGHGTSGAGMEMKKTTVPTPVGGFKREKDQKNRASNSRDRTWADPSRRGRQGC